MAAEDVNYFLMLSFEWANDVSWMGTCDNRHHFCHWITQSGEKPNIG